MPGIGEVMKQLQLLVRSLVIVVSIFGADRVLATEPLDSAKAYPVADWAVGIVDGTREVGYNVSVATDTVTGDTYISYYEGTVGGDLWLARTGSPNGNCGPGDAWECQAVDTAGVVGKFSSIAVGGTGQIAGVWISYYDVTTGSLKVAHSRIDRATGLVVTEESYIVDLGDPGGSGVLKGTRTSVTIGGSGNPFIAYQVELGGATRAVKYAYKLAPGFGNCGYGAGLDSWQCESVHIEDGIGDYLDIDEGPGGTRYIAFSTTHDTNAYPMIATKVTSPPAPCNASSDWSCAPIRNTGNDTGEYLAFESAVGAVKHLAYRNATAESLEWAKYVAPGNGNCGPGDDSYQCEWIDDIGPGTSPAGIDMKTDSGGNPIIVYQDLESGFEDLKIARPLSATPWGPVPNCGPNPGIMYEWFCETLETGSLASSYAYGGLSVALNANDEAAVAYREDFFDLATHRGRLKIAMEPISIFLDGFESGATSMWSAVVP